MHLCVKQSIQRGHPYVDRVPIWLEKVRWENEGVKTRFFNFKSHFLGQKWPENVKIGHFWNPPCVNFQKMVSDVKKNYSPGPYTLKQHSLQSGEVCPPVWGGLKSRFLASIFLGFVPLHFSRPSLSRQGPHLTWKQVGWGTRLSLSYTDGVLGIFFSSDTGQNWIVLAKLDQCR